MNILLTNDDGIHARGLWVLHKRFMQRHRVTVVAPDRERSAVSHAITLHEPLRVNRISINGGGWGYAVRGTPADCIKLGVCELLADPPDLVVAGINPGANVGVNVNYSGTVAAAKEAALAGIAAVSASVVGPRVNHYDEAAQFIVALADTIFKKGLPFGTFLNVNIPNRALKDVAGVRISRQSVGVSREYVEKRVDPRNRAYYWQGRDQQTFRKHPEIDGTALNQNFISITPIQCDMTDYRTLEDLKSWRLDKAIKCVPTHASDDGCDPTAE